MQTFYWEGIKWTPVIILGRLIWAGVALGITLVAAFFFRRFDPAYAEGMFYPAVTIPLVDSETDATVRPIGQIHLSRLASNSIKFHFGQMLLAELRLMIKGHHWWWYAVATGLIGVSLLAPIDVARRLILPLAWIWPLLLWAAIGTREARHYTNQLIFSTASPLHRQLPATWLAGVIVAMLAGSGVLIRLTMAGNWARVFAWAVGALFIPTWLWHWVFGVVAANCSK